jgi:hypothetical protein
MSAMSREGGTVVTSCDSACASCARRFSFGVLPYTSLRVRGAGGLASRLAAGLRRRPHGSRQPLFMVHDACKARVA